MRHARLSSSSSPKTYWCSWHDPLMFHRRNARLKVHMQLLPTLDWLEQPAGDTSQPTTLTHWHPACCPTSAAQSCRRLRWTRRWQRRSSHLRVARELPRRSHRSTVLSCGCPHAAPPDVTRGVFGQVPCLVAPPRPLEPRGDLAGRRPSGPQRHRLRGPEGQGRQGPAARRTGRRADSPRQLNGAPRASSRALAVARTAWRAEGLAPRPPHGRQRQRVTAASVGKGAARVGRVGGGAGVHAGDRKRSAQVNVQAVEAARAPVSPRRSVGGWKRREDVSLRDK